MAGGLGLSEFRRAMLEDRRIRRLVDYERMDQVFPGVDFEGGVCFFLWDRDNEGGCMVTTVCGDEVIGPVERKLNEYDIFVRDSRELRILISCLDPQDHPGCHTRNVHMGASAGVGPQMDRRSP